MTLQNLLAAITDYENGNRRILKGKLRAFLYKRKWYPLRAVVNQAAQYSTGKYEDWNVEKCLTELAYILPYAIRIKDVNFTGLPVLINESEALEEVRLVTNALNELVN